MSLDENAAAPAPAVASLAPGIPRYEWILLGLILVLAAALRIHDLGHKCFWIDELFTLESITQGNVAAYLSQPWNTIISPPPRFTHPHELIPWWQLLRPDPQDIHPPLYYVLARGWASAFGFG